MVAVSAGSGPSAASALSVETAAPVDGDQSTSPAQCAPYVPFHCAAEPSIQTVAPAHSIDVASSAVCTGPAVATLSSEAAGAATAKTAPAAKAVDAESSSIPQLVGESLSVEDVAQSLYPKRNSQLMMTHLL